MSGDIANAATLFGGASTEGLGQILQYGAAGLAVIILGFCFQSLRSLQKAALEGGKVTTDQIKPFVLLQCVYVGAAVLVFVIAVLAQKAPVNNTHKVAFSMSPAHYDQEDLRPRLVVSGGGERIEFREGTGQDNFSGERSYQLNVEALARSRDYFKSVYELSQVHAAANGGHDAKDNR